MKNKADESKATWLADELLLSRRESITPAPAGFTNRFMARVNPENKLSPEATQPILDVKKSTLAGLVFVVLFATGWYVEAQWSPFWRNISERLTAALSTDYTALLAVILLAVALLLALNERLAHYFLNRK